jgi:hypothetical protein
VFDASARVRLKCLNQQDRNEIDEWWRYKLEAAGKQDLLKIVIGEESGTLEISKPWPKQAAPENGSVV